MRLRKLYLISRNTNKSKPSKAVSTKMEQCKRDLRKMRTFSEVVRIVSTYRSVEIIFSFYILFSFHFSVLDLLLKLLPSDLFYCLGDYHEMKVIFDSSICI